MKKFTSTVVAAAQDPRTVARFILAFVASVLVVLLGLMAMSSGPNGATVFAQATESPTESPSPTGPSIKLLNPSPSYDPGYTLPPRPPGASDPPQISDKYDGVDRLYHAVAVTRDAPANAAIEAYFQPNVGLEMTVGVMNKVAGTEDTWELFWDIPDSMSATSGVFKVIMFAPTVTGFEEVASDETPARVDRAKDAAEITWPSQNGEIGFYKPKGGQWRTVVEGLTSSGTFRLSVFYSVTPPGDEVEYKECASDRAVAASGESGVDRFEVSCALSGKDLPSQVTAIAAVPGTPIISTADLSQSSADAHRVRPYVQEVSQMKIATRGVVSNPSTISGEDTSESKYPSPQYPSTERRQAMQPKSNPDELPKGCLKFEAVVTDHLDRPVQGANVDVHIQGPDDQAGFGADGTTGTSSEESNYKTPDKANHSKEPARFCNHFEEEDTRGDPPPNEETQGEHNVPGAADIKHIESTVGTGLDAPSGANAFRYGPGTFRFLVFSFRAGFTDITAWVDEQRRPDEPTSPEADDDVLTANEPSVEDRAQWLPAPASLTFSPRTDSATAGTCNRYVVRARAGNATIPGINVDVHASGPNNDLDFCDPGDGTPRRAPDQPEGDEAHQPEDDGEASHKSDSPDNPEVQHTEGETDADGNFVIGILSHSIGSSTLTAWIDGEQGQDNDVQHDDEPSGEASKSWAATAADAEVRFVNPSGYGNSGDRIAKTRDADERYHLVARVDLPDVVPGVEFFLGSGETFTKIGDAVRVEDSDTWELFWDVNVPDGSYTLRAQIFGTDKREDRTVTVRNNASETDPRIVPFETAELTRPLNAGPAPFENNATTVEGVASAGARGVEFYYTITAAAETRNNAQWIRCGGVTLPGGDAPQNFEGACTIPSNRTDVPLDVTGIAALAFICEATGCTVQQGQEVGRIKHSGDAHRVFGFEANPNIFLEPSEASGQAGVCKRFEARVVDRAGRAIPDANVDVHATGANVSFCDVEDGSQRRAPDRGGHTASPTQENEGIHQQEGDDTVHTEGETNSGGRFIFGLTSSQKGDVQLLAWVDQNDNDENDADERSASGVMHFTGAGSGSGRKPCTIKGNARDNVLRGTSGDDVICGFGGNDRLVGLGGNDVLRGGPGRDIIRGGRGRDVARGGAGPDRIRAGAGNDRLYGNKGNDFLNGQAGRRDSCRGGRGRDTTRNCER